MPNPAAPPNRSVQVAMLVGLVLATVACAVFAGWVDLHSEDVQASVVVLAGAGFAITVLFRRGGWLGGILAGFGVPLAHLYAHFAAVALPYPMPHPMTSFLALLPAAAGVLTGLALHAGVASVTGSDARRSR